MKDLLKSEKIQKYEVLRGIASLAVVVFHFNSPMLSMFWPTPISDFTDYGKYGVHVFFIISGFVIPWSLEKSRYTTNNYIRWMVRRFIRIAPPAYVAILFFILFYLIGEWYLGRPIRGMSWPGFDFITLFSNLTFTVDIFGTTWYNVVFWTLGVEFQFYLLIGIMFFTLKKYPWIIIVFVLIGFIEPLGDVENIFKYGSLFSIGLCVFLRKIDSIDSRYYYVLVLVCLGACLYVNGWPPMIFAIFTLIIINIPVYVNFGFLGYLGMISYSLYIIHPVAGPALEILLKQFLIGPYVGFVEIFLVLMIVLITVLIAAIYYKLFELPFLRFSKSFR